jgi:hypothetical protein
MEVFDPNSPSPVIGLRGLRHIFYMHPLRSFCLCSAPIQRSCWARESGSLRRQLEQSFTHDRAFDFVQRGHKSPTSTR